MSRPKLVRSLLPLLLSALFVVGCGDPDPAFADGELDCDSEVTWTEEGSVPEGTAGLGDPAAAIEAYLFPFMEHHGGDVVMVSATQGSLVVDGEEMVVGHASEMSDGGFLVLTGAGCDGFNRP